MHLLDVKEITFIILWVEIKSLLLTKNNKLVVALVKPTLANQEQLQVVDLAMDNQLPRKPQDSAVVVPPQKN